LRTPINFLTELANTEEGTSKLIENDCIQFLLDYLIKEETSTKHKKAVLWILAKICNLNLFFDKNIIRCKRKSGSVFE